MSLIFKSRNVISSFREHLHCRVLTRFLSHSNFQAKRLAFERSTRLAIRGRRAESHPRSLFRQRQWNLFDPVGGTSINRCTSRRLEKASCLSFSLCLSLFLLLFNLVSFSHKIGEFTQERLRAIFNTSVRENNERI